MKTVSVTASKSYDVLIGSGLLNQLGQITTKTAPNCKIAIISDTNVWPLYGYQIEATLKSAGHSVIHYVFPPGEESKNGTTYLDILNHLATNQITRSDILVALGGGVVGDMTGFVAATFLRGISFIQVPTTLLAMVDSSVGGKTAIDLPAGKNLAGAFYQPVAVLCDINTLSTLPDEVFRDGCAEVIKYGILYDEALFAHLESHGPAFDRESVICRCVELKRNVVNEDEFDRGDRQKLNLGHTIGHGIEACSHYVISHGLAVSAGIAIVTRAATAMGLCQKETCNRVLEVLHHFSLPANTTYSAQSLYEYALSDKKRSGNIVNLIIPCEIGNCIIQPMPTEKLESFIETGL